MRLAAIFPACSATTNGFVQIVQVFDAATIVTLDTLNEARSDHDGLLCERAARLPRTALASAPADRPLLLFQHHPPFDTGLRYMDTIKLANPDAEWEVIARTRRPDYLFMGHLHRPIAGYHGAASPSTSSARWHIRSRSTSRPRATFPARTNRRTIRMSR